MNRRKFVSCVGAGIAAVVAPVAVVKSINTDSIKEAYRQLQEHVGWSLCLRHIGVTSARLWLNLPRGAMLNAGDVLSIAGQRGTIANVDNGRHRADVHMHAPVALGCQHSGWGSR